MGFTIAWKTAEELGLMMMEGESNPVLPSIREHPISIPGRNGEIDQGSEFEPRYITIPCIFYKANNLEELDAYVRGLSYILTDTFGKPRTVPLVFDSSPHKTYFVRLSSNIPLSKMVLDGEITLSLKASEPYAFGPEQIQSDDVSISEADINLVSAGNIATPLITTIKNTGISSVNGFTLKLFIQAK